MATIFSLFIHHLVTISFVIDSIQARHIDCSNHQCHNTFINCLPNENCYIPCTETQSCFRSVINCPIHGDCTIQCPNHQSCAYIVIDAALSFGHLNLTCGDTDTGSTNHCQGMKIYGSTYTLPKRSNDIQITCNGHSDSCIQSHIHCAKHSPCTVSCNGDTSCKYTTITGSADGDLTIHCNGESSCYMSQFQGDMASTLTITGCTEYDSCSLLSLYCPPHTNNIKNCFIQGNDNFGKGYSITTIPQIVTEQSKGYRDESYDKSKHNHLRTSSLTLPAAMYNATGVVIFARNGWKDIDIEYSGTFGELHGGVMVCGEDYSVSCVISSDDWACEERNAYCNDVDGLFTIDGDLNRLDGE
eukprot:276655_1